MNRLKLMYLANSPHIGGGNRSLLRMVQKVKGDGHDVFILVPGEGKLVELLTKENIKYIIFNHRVSNKFSKIDFIRKLFKYIKIFYSYSPDIIHVNDLFCYSIASIAARILNIPLCCHMRYSVEQNSVNYYLKALPDVIIFNSHYMKELFLEKNPYFSLSVKKEVIYNFFDPNDYYCPNIRNTIRNQWSADAYFLVGVIGNLSPQKGHNTFLRMAKEVLKISRNFRFVIIGEDLDPTNCNELYIKSLIKELNIEEFVIWLGFKDNIGEVLSALDTLVVPSTYEPFGRVAVEGLLAGLPVVASRIGGLVEILEGAPCGFLVEPNNVKEFVDKVLEIYEKEKRYPVILNIEYAINNFSEKVTYQKLKSVYFDMIK